MTVLDRGSQNPRIQCGECGQWKRLHGVKDGKAIDRFYGSCEVTLGDHPCGREVCTNCCPDKCRERLGCDCQNPEPKTGAALVSESCPIHGELGPTLSTTVPRPHRESGR